jgi:hypothetical protein
MCGVGLWMEKRTGYGMRIIQQARLVKELKMD